MSETKEILTKHKLRKTKHRAAVLDVFLEQEHALSHKAIEQQLGQQLDRVTLYRTLNAFLEKGIIHKVLDDSEAAKYALCSEACSEEGHQHNHVHFKCTQCGTSECIEGLEVPEVNLPEKYKAVEANLLVEGVCPACR